MRIGVHTRIKPGHVERYEEYHRTVWPDLLNALRRVGIRQYVIFRDGLDLFHYIECDDYEAAVSELANDPTNVKWQAEMAPMLDVVHDYTQRGRDRLALIFDLEPTHA
jgi:L-rhamnose mutarotase